MKKFNWTLLVAVLFITSLVFNPVMIMASDITSADFYGILTISNNSTAATNVSTNGTLNTPSMISSGYLNASANNTAVRNTSGTDMPFMPGYGTNAWCLFVPSIGANTYLSNLLYTGDVTGGKIRYFPSTGNMTTLDNNVNLELAANFSVQISGYFDSTPAVNKYPIYKQDAFKIYYPSAGNITARIATANSDLITQAASTANYVITDGTTRFAQVFTVGASDIDLSTVNLFFANTTGAATGTLNVAIRAVDAGTHLPTGSDIVATTKNIATIAAGGAAYDFSLPCSLTAGTEYAIIIYSTDIAVNTVVGTYSNANPYAGGTECTSADGSTWVSVGANDLVFIINGNTAAVAVTTPCTSADHVVVAYADGTDLGIQIDGGAAVTQALGGATVQNNGNNYISFMNNSMPYVEYQKIYVGGNLRQNVSWQYGTTFTDQSSGGNNATPTFRTASSNPNVYFYMSTFLPVEEARAPAYALSAAPNFITTAPNITGNYTTAISPNFPGASVITSLASASSTPVQLPFVIITGFLIIIISLVISWLMRRFNANSRFIKVGVLLACMGLATVVGVFDPWMSIIFGILVIAIAMAADTSMATR
jgi:hypothetical protein